MRSSIPAGATVQFKIEVFSFKSENENGLGAVIASVYDRYHKKPPKSAGHGVRRAARDISNAISKDAYNPRTNNYALIMLNPVSDSASNTFLMKRRFTPADYRAANEGLIGWTNGAVVAVPLLQASYRLGDGRLRSQAVRVIDEIVDRSLNPATGIPFCAKVDGRWTNNGWWAPWIRSEGVKPGHSSHRRAGALLHSEGLGIGKSARS